MLSLRKLLLLLILSFIFLSMPTGVFAKSYYFPKIDVSISIEKNGSIDITEQRTTYFNGSFSQIYWNIPLSTNQTISNVYFKNETGTSYTQTPEPDSVNRPQLTYSATYNVTDEHIVAYFSAYNQIKPLHSPTMSQTQ